MADAGGAFVTRAFERMLKDATGKKNSDLQKALKAYLDRPQLKKAKAAPSPPPKPTPPPSDASSEQQVEGITSPPPSQVSSPARSPVSSPPREPTAGNAAAATMGLAGQSLEGAEAELVVLPMKLAMEAKNPKLVEPALDCLHKLIAYGHLEGEAGIDGGRKSSMMTELFNMVCACGSDVTAADSVVLQVIKVLLTAVASNTFQVHGECLLKAINTCYSIVLQGKSVINQRTAKTTLTQMIDTVFKRMELDVEVRARAEKEAAAALAASEAPVPAQEVESAKPVVRREDISLSSLTPVEGEGGEEGGAPREDGEVPAVSVEELQHMAADADMKGLEAALEKAVELSADPSQPTVVPEELRVSEQDALLVFRELCKMAMSEATDELSLRTKNLSLELLQCLLESVPDSFTVNFAFIDAVKQHLCFALLRACVSPSPVVFQLGCSIFAALLLRFRESLKAEVGVFFPLVVLRSLDSSDSPIHQRSAVLKMVDAVAKDMQMLADVFVNYDCDLEATNLFERMVNSLSRIAQGTPSNDPTTIQLAQNVALKEASLKCLVTVLNSMVMWTKRGLEQKIGASPAPAAKKDKDGPPAAEETPGYAENSKRFMSAKAHKSNVEAAVIEFNLKPSKGIKFLLANKLVEEDPKSIARFLRSTPGLDKTQVGDYLGHHEEFNVSVMHAYVDDMNFGVLKFDDAIREFLKGFRLPGEAQKIDRMMEKFAERYCRDNPGLFRNADTAYVLAYAVIMLNTDAHNPMVWPKMSKADFVRINSGSNSGSTTGEATESETAPVAMLEEIYDSIVSNEIKMKDEGLAASTGGHKPRTSVSGRSALPDFGLVGVLNLAVPKRRGPGEKDTKTESEAIVQKTQSLFSKRGGVKRGVFNRAANVELVKPMLEAVGWPLLAAFSVTMEDSDNRSRVSVCMEGFRLGIHLCKLLSMETMRYAFLTSLVRFTFLHAPRDMRTKNVEALRTLLQLAEQESDALQDSWQAVLECISRLEHVCNTPAISATLMHAANQISRESLMLSLNELAGTPSERIFISTVKLPSDMIVEFFTALCGISAEELKQTPPRVFSLQKLVEIAYYNMPRIRMVWARIWSVLSSHFVAAGQHQDEKIAMYAIDSLRQLGIKYLERSELANFTFQNDIMKPFVIIMRNSRNPMIRELIVQCIVQMIKSKVGSIKSGWRSVFMIFTTAASDGVEAIVDSSFENVEQVVLEHFDQVVGDCFLDCVNCLIAFANNKVSADISLKAISMLRICEDRLAEGHIPGGQTRPVEENGKPTDTEVAEYYWFPMLAGLSDLTSDPRDKVRSVALEVLFDLLKERGTSFSGAFWESVFLRVLFPIFDYVRHVGKDDTVPIRPNEWLRHTCLHCLELLCDLFCEFYKEVSFLLPSLLALLLDCATRPDQGLAAISIGALVRLMDIGGEQFGEKDWTAFLNSIRDACASTCPLELLNPDILVMGDDASTMQSRRASVSSLAPRHSYGGPGEVLNDAALAAAAAALVGRSPTKQLSTLSPLHASNGYRDTDEAKSGGGSRDFSEEGPSSPKSDRGSQGGGGSRVHPTRGDGDDSEAGFESEQGDSVPALVGSGPSLNSTWGKSFAQRMMDTILLKNLSIKGKGRPADAPILTTPPPPAMEEDDDDDASVFGFDLEQSQKSVLDMVRTKCLVQLLLLDALDRLQKGHWLQLAASHKSQIVDIVQTMVDFASAYDSDTNLRRRKHLISSDRPPPSLMRLEVEGTQLYMAVLLRAIGDPAADHLKDFEDHEDGHRYSSNGNGSLGDDEDAQQLKDSAETRLVRFCAKVLEDAASAQPVSGEHILPDAHASHTLRAPITIKVLTAMCRMSNSLFQRHLHQFYPHFNKLICSDQMEVRRALGDLFKARLVPIAP